MNKVVVLSALVLAILGVFLLGQGITGLVFSQTCCFPPNCQVENQCKINDIRSPTPFTTYSKGVYIGSVFILVSILVYLVLHHKK